MEQTLTKFEPDGTCRGCRDSGCSSCKDHQHANTYLAYASFNNGPVVRAILCDCCYEAEPYEQLQQAVTG